MARDQTEEVDRHLLLEAPFKVGRSMLTVSHLTASGQGLIDYCFLLVLNRRKLADLASGQ